MNTFAQPSSISKGALWTGRVLSGIIVAFLLFDCITKILKVPQVVAATEQVGYAGSLTNKIGCLLLIAVILYVIPRTSILGAIVLTGYLGGAVATHVRHGDPVWEMSVPFVFGVIVWGALWFREARVRALIPIKSSAN